MACSLLSICVLPALAGQFTPSAAEQTAAAAITEGLLRAHVRFLADDLLEGRGPGSRGDALAQRYIQTQLEALGLKPAAPEGGWFQSVPLVGVDTRAPETMKFSKGDTGVELRRHDEFIASSGRADPAVAIRDAEVVFAGYGIVAPEFQWDDFKGVDLRGKVLLIMNNDPSTDTSLFQGETRLFYGRWDYKYEEAARKGAAAAIIIHTTPSAGYPWQVVQTSWTGEQFELHGEHGPRLDMRSWVTEEAARKIVKVAGRDLDELRRGAESRTFRPVPLGIQLSIDLSCRVRHVKSANVLGMLPGSDPELAKEVLLCTAHHDHLGIEEGPPAAAQAPGSPRVDRIYNGAVDNASGVAAMLSLARAFSALPTRPARSIVFAAVAGEEQGLLGSLYLAGHPPVPAGFIAADVNIDGVNILGRTRDVTSVGRGKSTLDAVLDSVAAWQGRKVKGDQFPDRGFFYRSDQFSFAKIGAPGIYLDSGTDFVGRPEGWGKEKLEEWERTRYHQPSDEYSDDWDLSGAIEDLQLLFYTSLRVAQSPALPAWTPGDEFEAARKSALEARGR